jgi:hypothetical protein
MRELFRKVMWFFVRLKAKCQDKGDPKIVERFKYRDKYVIGIYDLSTCQFIRTYFLIWLWILITLYVIVMNGICDCLYLTVATATPVIVITIGVFLYTFFTKKMMVKANHVYDN